MEDGQHETHCVQLVLPTDGLFKNNLSAMKMELHRNVHHVRSWKEIARKIGSENLMRRGEICQMRFPIFSPAEGEAPSFSGD